MINADWHKAHPMPPRATRAERVAWHAEHQVACGCRDVPDDLRDEVAKLAKAAHWKPRK